MATKGDISDLEVLQFGGKPLVPRIGYERTNGNNVIRSDVAGGATRQRKKYSGSVHTARATFYGSTLTMDYLQLFFTRNEGKRFICYTMADRPIVEPYVVQVVSDWTFNNATAVDGSMSVTLEIFPARDKCLDEYLAVTYPCWGDQLCDILQAYEDAVS